MSRELGGKTGPAKSLAQKAINWYLNNYLQSLFAGAFETHDYTPIPPNIPLPKEEKIQEAAELLSKAKKPVILIGSQATLPPVSVNILKENLEVIRNFTLKVKYLKNILEIEYTMFFGWYGTWFAWSKQCYTIETM